MIEIKTQQKVLKFNFLHTSAIFKPLKKRRASSFLDFKKIKSKTDSWRFRLFKKNIENRLAQHLLQIKMANFYHRLGVQSSEKYYFLA